MAKGTNVPKLTVEITRAQQNRLAELFPHGTIKPTIGLLLDELMDLMQTHGSGSVIGAVLDRRVSLSRLLPTLRKVDDIATPQPPKEKF